MPYQSARFFCNLISIVFPLNRSAICLLNKSKSNASIVSKSYSTLLDNTYGDREQELPEVKEAKVISTEAMKYKMGDKEKDAYLVKLEWSFEKDMGYDTKGSVVLVKEETTDYSKMTVAELKEVAAAKEINVAGMKKAEIIEALTK